MSKSFSGTLARLGLMDKDRSRSGADMLKRVATDKLETIRFLFADQHGILRGKSVVAEAAESVLDNGITAPSSLLLKDTSGRTVFPVWTDDIGLGPGVLTGAGDMVLVPNPDTYRRLPWSPHSAWVLCDVVQPNGTEIPFASRTVLRACQRQLTERDLTLKIGLEVEFHVFGLGQGQTTHEAGGMPGNPPLTYPLNQGYQLLSDVAYSQTEPLLDELRRTANGLGLPVRSVEVEFGPSQFEFTFEPACVTTHADNMVFFRTMVKEVCAKNGLHATFMSRPILPNCAASGWHVHQSLQEASTNRNLFEPRDHELTKEASGWMAGLLEHAGESCVLTTPTVNGYGRYKPGQLAPDRVQWSRDNKGTMLRALMQAGDSSSRLENRIAEPGANPYFVLASQIACGLRGLDAGLVPPAPVTTPYDSKAPSLPDSLLHAIERFEKGSLYADTFGDAFRNYISQIKRAEWTRYKENPEDWEHREYFQLI